MLIETLQIIHTDKNLDPYNPETGGVVNSFGFKNFVKDIELELKSLASKEDSDNKIYENFVEDIGTELDSLEAPNTDMSDKNGK